MGRPARRKNPRSYFLGWTHQRILDTFIESGYIVLLAGSKEVRVGKGFHLVDVPLADAPHYIWPQPLWCRFRVLHNLRVITLRGTTTFEERR